MQIVVIADIIYLPIISPKEGKMNSEDAKDGTTSLDCKNKSKGLECKYHQELKDIRNKLDLIYDAISSEPSKANLENYVKYNKRKEALESIIAVAEYKDIKVGIKNINVDLNNEMKILLTKKIGKIDIDDIDWTSYVKAAINFTTAQSYGSQIESVYIRKNAYKKVDPSEERGDVLMPESGKYIEVKFTVVSFPTYQYDVVQIRPHHNIEEYHIITFNKDTDKTEFYLLTKEEMNNEIKITGDSLAHGTKKNQSLLVNPEYAIRFRIDSETHKRWQKYLKPVHWL